MTVTAKCLIESKSAAASANTEYACVTKSAIIDKFTATNTDASARTLTVYLVASGGSVGVSTTVIAAKSIAAGATYDVTELQNHILLTGDFISVFASAASLVTIRCSGREIT